MVGEGDLRPEMEKYIAEHKLKNTFLTGFVNQSTIASYYAMSDVFVMCSGIGETWGLSVNEAMNFEKPVIVSRTCGCASDLVKHGINGFLFQEGDIEELASCIDKVLSEDTFRLSAGKASAEIIRQYSNAVIVQNIMTAINE
jgi:glycosyltransferase involved in cell wall biosynthesis